MVMSIEQRQVSYHQSSLCILPAFSRCDPVSFPLDHGLDDVLGIIQSSNSCCILVTKSCCCGVRFEGSDVVVLVDTPVHLLLAEHVCSLELWSSVAHTRDN